MASVQLLSDFKLQVLVDQVLGRSSLGHEGPVNVDGVGEPSRPRESDLAERLEVVHLGPVELVEVVNAELNAALLHAEGLRILLVLVFLGRGLLRRVVLDLCELNEAAVGVRGEHLGHPLLLVCRELRQLVALGEVWLGQRMLG